MSRPKVALIGTGGTISSLGRDGFDVQDYITLGQMLDAEGMLAKFPRLSDLAEVLGEDRSAAMCRELTKKFEEVRRAPLSELAASLAQTPVKGEIVLLVDRKHSVNINEVDIESELRDALKTLSVRDAADLVAKAHDLPRRQVYQAALKLGKGET